MKPTMRYKENIMANRHPRSELLVEYTSGVLSLAPSIAVTAHLQFCGSCNNVVQSLEQLGGDLLDHSENINVSNDLFEKVLLGIEEPNSEPEIRLGNAKNAVDEIASALPSYVRKFLPEGALQWRFLSPSLKLATISVGETTQELALHRIKAGGKAPEHDHQGQEITVVLTGCFSDEDGLYRAGDFVVRNHGDVHRPIASQNEECICLSVLSAPIKLTGAKRVLNPFLKFLPS
jgi:putative transcriptional regulator